MIPSLEIWQEALLVSERLTHASIVKFCRCKLAGLPKDTPSLAPSKLKACPFTPDANLASPTKVPGLLPAASAAFPSPFHQPISPGIETQPPDELTSTNTALVTSDTRRLPSNTAAFTVVVLVNPKAPE